MCDVRIILEMFLGGRVTHPNGKFFQNVVPTLHTQKKTNIYVLKLFINSVPASTRLMCQVVPKEGNDFNFINSLIIIPNHLK